MSDVADCSRNLVDTVFAIALSCFGPSMGSHVSGSQSYLNIHCTVSHILILTTEFSIRRCLTLWGTGPRMFMIGKLIPLISNLLSIL